MGGALIDRRRYWRSMAETAYLALLFRRARTSADQLLFSTLQKGIDRPAELQQRRPVRNVECCAGLNISIQQEYVALVAQRCGLEKKKKKKQNRQQKGKEKKNLEQEGNVI